MKSTLASPRMAVGLVTLAIWAVAAGSALYWGMRASGVQNRAVPPVAGSMQGASVDTQAVARALGAIGPTTAPQAAAPDVLSRLALQGVVTHGAGGAALIAVDDKPAKPFRVGAEVDSGWSVKSVSSRSVVLSSGTREASLDMPPFSERGKAAGASPAGRPPVMIPPRPATPAMPARPRA